MAKLFANSGDPDQTPHSAASDLGLHCLQTTLLWVFRLQWVRVITRVDAGVDVSTQTNGWTDTHSNAGVTTKYIKSDAITVVTDQYLPCFQLSSITENCPS